MKMNHALKIEEHLVPKQLHPIRLSDYAGGIFVSIPSRKGMKKAIDKGLLTLNDKVAKTADFLHGGETLALYQPEKTMPINLGLDLKILFEDEHLAIVFKPPGILVSGNRKWTLQNALPACITKSKLEDALTFPEPIHRLDYPTSGALIIGKTSAAVIALNKMFEHKEIEKQYVAVTVGSMSKSGEIKDNIDDKPSHSNYEVIATIASEKYEFLNLVKLRPETGRRHQLRKHLASIGNPIFGDAQYGIKGQILMGKGLYLHAYTLNFVHPITNETLNVTAPLSKKYLKLFPEFS